MTSSSTTTPTDSSGGSAEKPPKRKHRNTMHLELVDSNFAAPSSSSSSLHAPSSSSSSTTTTTTAKATATTSLLSRGNSTSAAAPNELPAGSASPRSLTPTNAPFVVPSCLTIEPESPGGTQHGVLLTPHSAKYSGGRRVSESEILDKHMAMSIDLRAEGAHESDSWLTGVFIDYIFQRFAHQYEDTVFLPTAFAAVQLPQLFRSCRAAGDEAQALEKFRAFEMVDVLGRRIPAGIWNRRRQSTTRYRQVLMLHNAGANHWTLLRIIPPRFVHKPSSSELAALERRRKEEALAKERARQRLLSQQEKQRAQEQSQNVDVPPPAKKTKTKKPSPRSATLASAPAPAPPKKHFPAPAEIAPRGKTWDYSTGRWISLRTAQKLAAVETKQPDHRGQSPSSRRGQGAMVHSELNGQRLGHSNEELEPGPQMNLFEPMGKPSGRGRSRGVSRRSLPQGILEWLDAVSPLTHLNAPHILEEGHKTEGGSDARVGGGSGSSGTAGRTQSHGSSNSSGTAGGGSAEKARRTPGHHSPALLDMMLRGESIDVQWKSCSQSVLTTAKQENSFDCGVACLLYAECCALGWTMDEMRREIGQPEITFYRALLEKYIKAIAGVGSAAIATEGTALEPAQSATNSGVK